MTRLKLSRDISVVFGSTGLSLLYFFSCRVTIIFCPPRESLLCLELQGGSLICFDSPGGGFIVVFGFLGNHPVCFLQEYNRLVQKRIR